MAKRFDPEFARRAFAELYATPRTKVTLGKSVRTGRSVKVDISELSIYIVGSPGAGKSTLMARLFLENQDHSKILIDPQGKMTRELILPNIQDPERVIYFCPAEQWDSPLGFNPFDMGALHAPSERDLLVNEVQQVFAHLWVDSFKNYPVMAMIFRNALQVMVRVEGSTFLDMARFLIDKEFRQKKLCEIDDSYLYDFWTRQYSKDMALSSYNKIDAFVSSSTVRNIVCQRKSSFYLREAMKEGKIVLVDLGGDLGRLTANLLGGLIVSQVLSAIQRRMRKPTESLKPFAIFVDEFQRFGGTAFETIIAECRQQRSSVCIAHQYLSQLDHRMQKAVRQCAYLVCFGGDADTSRIMREEFASRPDLGHVRGFHAWVKINPHKKGKPPIEEEIVTRKLERGDRTAFERFNEMAKRRYGRPKRDVEAELDVELEEVQRKSYEKTTQEAQEGSKEPLSAQPSEPEPLEPHGLRPLGLEDHRLAGMRDGPSVMPPRLARQQRDKLRGQNDSVSEGV